MGIFCMLISNMTLEKSECDYKIVYWRHIYAHHSLLYTVLKWMLHTPKINFIYEFYMLNMYRNNYGIIYEAIIDDFDFQVLSVNLVIC